MENKFLSPKIKRFIFIVACPVLLLFLGFADYLTGHETSFSIFYLSVVMMAGWFVGRGYAFFISVLSAMVWLAADIYAGHYYSHQLIPIWNGVIWLGFFLVIGYFLTEIRFLLEREKATARTDYLTGIINRRYFYELLSLEMAKTRRFHHPFTVAYIDVDNFKQVNDTMGHRTGDVLLMMIASAIKKNLREIDVVARLGGDEFAVLMTETDGEQARTGMNRIQSYWSSMMLEHRLNASLSIGVVTCMQVPDDLEDLIKMADNLMYAAKRKGKNMVEYVVYYGAMNSENSGKEKS